MQIKVDSYSAGQIDGGRLSTSFFTGHTPASTILPHSESTIPLIQQIKQPWEFIRYPAADILKFLGLDHAPTVFALICTETDFPPKNPTDTHHGRYTSIVGESINAGLVGEWYDAIFVIPFGNHDWDTGYFLDNTGYRLMFTLGHELSHYLIILSLRGALSNINLLSPNPNSSISKHLTFQLWEGMADLATGGRFHAVAGEEYFRINGKQPLPPKRMFDLLTSIPHPLLSTSQLTNELMVALILHLNNGGQINSYRYNFATNQNLYIEFIKSIIKARQNSQSLINFGLECLFKQPEPDESKLRTIRNTSRDDFLKWFTDYQQRYHLIPLVEDFYQCWLTEVQQWHIE